jgi:peptidoglycan hydrolase-like protein with peptidoglycan-binding domain
MTYALIWLPQVLRDAGLKVAETDGWADRGRREMGTVRGVMCHHTGSAGASGNMPTLNVLKVGRSDLPGPLSQLGLGRDGTYYVVAAGLCNHAGPGKWQQLTTGNSSFIGIEAENGGGRNDGWPDVQMDAYRRGVAAILRHIGADAEMCCGHREYALPPGRKDDPLFDMNAFRQGVRDIMRGVAPVRPLIPPSDPANGRPTLKRGDRGPLVLIVQENVGVSKDGKFGPGTEAAVRVFQRLQQLVPDGIVGPKTWALMKSPPPPP